MRILVATEDAGLREVIQAALERMDYETEAVDNGFTASERIRNYFLDFVIADVELPGVAGHELAYEAKDLAHPPFVIVMGRREDVPQRFWEYIDYILPKPFGVPELAAAIETATKRVVA
ncbi:MAG: response regulator transcription factor [Candidatus Magasanikbacteria bacterium]|nr:response regulator transcription factor [Candidatus Magasanikbacteria bacterium]